MIWAARDNQKTAEEDIICWKIVCCNAQNQYKSYFQLFPYTRGEKYSTKFTYTILKDYWVHGGYELNVHKGFHSYRKNSVATRVRDGEEGTKVIKCIIPKGAKYYINKDNTEYCSNQIIIK